jgi:hypothetical protein
MRLTQPEGTVVFPRRPGLRPTLCLRVPAVSVANLGDNGPASLGRYPFPFEPVNLEWGRSRMHAGGLGPYRVMPPGP